MSSDKPIDAEVVPELQALVVRESQAVGRAMTIDELRSRLQFVRQVMQQEMRDGTDYGKIPGCGEKPTLLQPGAQKLLMTFNLREQIKKEVMREFGDNRMHREYELVVTVFPSGTPPENGWDGVGTCSTLEEKYRYRKAERKCPKCGKSTIIKGKAEYGGGWICFAKKGGCGAKFPENDSKITSQPRGKTEHENPADYWNTVRKMAFKRALVAAAINATNTSELWTQDLEDVKAGAEAPEMPSDEPEAPDHHTIAPPTPAKASTPKPAKAHPVSATPKTREWMIRELNALEGSDDRRTVTEFFDKAGVITQTQAIEAVPLSWVPVNKVELLRLKSAIMDFASGGQAHIPYEQHAPGAAAPEPQQDTKKPIEVPRDPPSTPETTNSEWFFDVMVPVPRKGMKRDEYLKNPDTIESLFEARHDDTAEAQEARQRLWGFVNHYEPKGWTKQDGTVMPPSEGDKKFREALDAFAEWFEKHHPGEKL